MLNIPDALQERLDSGATTLCACWRILRRDGATLGFTDHDAIVTFDGIDHAPEGFSASAQESATGLGIDNLRIAGALRSDAITEADIARGRYDGATVERWLVDWLEPSARLLVFRGRIGEITHGESAFSAEIEGLSAALNRPIGRAYLPSCDADLGDRRCGVRLDGSPFRVAGAVVAWDGGAELTVSGCAAHASGVFSMGVLRWTSGRNAGLAAQVRAHSARDGVHRLMLAHGCAAAVEVGDAFTLDAGCDKSMACCRDKFGNLLNFRGFPHMPGDGWLLSRTAEGALADGGSLYA